MKIKICGMRDAENICNVAQLHPDYMGFIFHSPSPRNCDNLLPQTLKELPEGIEPVAVTVNMDEEEIRRIVAGYDFRTIQLHGHESPEMCFSLRSMGLKVIKAISMKSAESLEDIGEYEGAVDMFLLDTACHSHGGSGKKFDWNILDSYDFEEDFMLSGGIGPDDAQQIGALRHPRLAGIDLNSRFETEPGVKDPQLLKRFMDALRY